jgi:hypothetical protein
MPLEVFGPCRHGAQLLDRPNTSFSTKETKKGSGL